MLHNKENTEASRPAKRPARPKMIDDVVAQENRRLHEENAMLKATMEEFKSLLAESLHEDAEERGKMRFEWGSHKPTYDWDHYLRLIQ